MIIIAYFNIFIIYYLRIIHYLFFKNYHQFKRKHINEYSFLQISVSFFVIILHYIKYIVIYRKTLLIANWEKNLKIIKVYFKYILL